MTAPRNCGEQAALAYFSLEHSFVLICECLYREKFQGRCEIAFEVCVALIICVLFPPFTIEAFLLSGAHDGRKKSKEKEMRFLYATAPFPIHRAKSQSRGHARLQALQTFCEIEGAPLCAGRQQALVEGPGFRADRLGFHAHLCYFFGWETKGKALPPSEPHFPQLGHSLILSLSILMQITS